MAVTLKISLMNITKLIALTILILIIFDSCIFIRYNSLTSDVLNQQYQPRNYTPSNSAVKVYIVNFNLSKGASTYPPAWQHFVLDALLHSRKLQQTYNAEEDGAVWIMHGNGQNCFHGLVLKVAESMNIRRNQMLHSMPTTNPDTDLKVRGWKLFLFDWHDVSKGDVYDCLIILSNLLGKQNVHYATRVHARGRKVTYRPYEAENVTFHDQGQRIDYTKHKISNAIHDKVGVLHYCVRSDLVEYIESVQLTNNKTESSQLINVVTQSRPFDVAHFWNMNTAPGEGGTHRTAISKAIVSLHAEHENMTVFTKTVGDDAVIGRSTLQKEYAKALIEYKIIVVCQRDYWEGHFRLMEALAGGALVMTDPMHILPYKLQNGESVIVYNSIDELKEKILYYLERKEERLKIANKGHMIAMMYHRSWHSLERLVLGN